MKRKVLVLSNKEIAKNVFEMVVFAKIEDDIICGQFAHIQLKNKSLRRPFCICDFSKKEDTLTFVYEVKGEGTAELSSYVRGTELDVLFPLGNGFRLLPQDKKIYLVGGGLGSAVLPAALSSYNGEFTSFLGFQSREKIILDKELSKGGKVHIATEDGSFGHRGFITEVLDNSLKNEKPDVILACGPMPMIKSLHKIVNKYNVKTMVSLEARMGCGVGACVVCAVKIKRSGGLYNLRVCKDGPVFDINEVIYE